jgi:hypothetical protein
MNVRVLALSSARKIFTSRHGTSIARGGAALGIPADSLSEFFQPLLAYARAVGVDVRL